MPIAKISHPMKTTDIRIRFCMKMVIVKSPAQVVIPDINNITQVILSFLFIMKSDIYIIKIPWEIRRIPIVILRR